MFCVCAARWLQPVLAQLISTLRAPKSSEGYKKIGGGSPLRRITQEQANALEEALRVRGQDAHVYVGMRYWYPFMEDAVAQVGPAALRACSLSTEKAVGPVGATVCDTRRSYSTFWLATFCSYVQPACRYVLPHTHS